MKLSNFFLFCSFFFCSAAFFSCDTDSGSSGSTSSAQVVSSPTKEKADAVGDIIFADGTAVPYSENLALSSALKSKAVAVVFYRGNNTSALGEKLLAVGVKHDKAGQIWCDTSARAYARNLPGITCTATRQADGSLSFSGDLVGSDNIDQIGLSDSYIQWRYPAFYFAINYKNSFSTINGTAFENGWYLPTVAELYQIWANKAVVDAALVAAGGDSFDVDNYWSSSVDGVSESCASRLLFAYGTVDSSCKKSRERCVCAVRAF